MMELSLAKKMLSGIAYSMGRNRVSGRPVKEVTITPQDLVDMFSEQGGKCYWSGLPLDPNYNKIKHHPFAISPERLDNAGPYSKENVRLCRRMFNLGRMAFPENDFQEVMNELKVEFKELAE
jgi:hypothetical protein